MQKRPKNYIWVLACHPQFNFKENCIQLKGCLSVQKISNYCFKALLLNGKFKTLKSVETQNSFIHSATCLVFE